MMTKTLRALWVIVVLLAAASCSVTAQPPNPVEAAQEERALGVVKAIQTGDASRLEAFMHANWVPAEDSSDRAQRWPRIAKSLTDRHANIEIVGVMIDKLNSLTVVTEAPEGEELRFVFEFSPDPPYLIAAMGVEAGPAMAADDMPPLKFAPGTNRGQLRTALGGWFENLTAEDRFSGAVLVEWRGETIFEGAYGQASRRWNIANDLETRFDLGSINKSFTKIAIGQLVASGKMALDDLIVRWLPDYPSAAVAEKVTVRHLLEHSSGLGDIFTEEFFNSSKALYREPRDFFPLFADKALQFEPGASQSYSNAGFMVLGAIIEEVSGESYYDYVTRHIFEPAGMSSTGFFAGDESVAKIAEGYTRHGEDQNDHEIHSNIYMLPARGNSAGSAQATAGDLLRFNNAIREARLLSPEFTDWYFGAAEPSGSLGSDAMPKRATAGNGIAGGAPGVSAVLESDGDLALIVLSNYDAPIAEQVARTLYRPLRKALAETSE